MGHRTHPIPVKVINFKRLDCETLFCNTGCHHHYSFIYLSLSLSLSQPIASSRFSPLFCFLLSQSPLTFRLTLQPSIPP
ncbi:hypothetical protein QVD17_25893 [Tagetes erecta]|uniref:Uncharacterized protein n=1 Tax=Tagetes erecta TaxID=13708 RepID=A0AAD8NPV0_TARER|nr:hypothetical protein QVD17_25893 [Tagetes erecta]